MTERSRARLPAIVQHSSDLIVILEPDGALRTLNGSFAPIFGVDGRRPRLAAGPRAPRRRRARRRLPRGRRRARRPASPPRTSGGCATQDGSYRHIEAVATNLLGDGVVDGLVLTARDVEARKRFEEQLRHRAFHDELTGLANRALFFDRVEHALHRGTRADAQVAVMFVDLDDFKAINDRLGHAGRRPGAAGGRRALQRDRALGRHRRAARRRRVRRPARGRRAARARSRRPSGCWRRCARPWSCDGEEIRGLGQRRHRDRRAPRRATSRTCCARATSRCTRPSATASAGWSVYDARDGRADAPDRRPLTWFMRSDEQHDEIRSLLEDPDALTMAFQPIMDLRTGRIAGYEALSRFNRTPYRSPDQWFAQAHRCGLGYAVEAKALAAALALPGRPRRHVPGRQPEPVVADRGGDPGGAARRACDELVIEVTENELVVRRPGRRWTRSRHCASAARGSRSTTSAPATRASRT